MSGTKSNSKMMKKHFAKVFKKPNKHQQVSITEDLPLKAESVVEPTVVSQNTKRQDYIGWDDFFMGTAFLAAMRSKDPATQVGACVVNTDKKIVGIGYNGMPTGCSDDQFPWGKNTPSPFNSKYLYVCHAEMNAILNKNVVDLKGCTIYVALFPCNECAKLIIQSGIREVVYYSDKNHDKVEVKAAKRMFESAGVIYTAYVPKDQKIEIDFSKLKM